MAVKVVVVTYRVCGVTCVMATVARGTSVVYTDFQMPLDIELAGPVVSPDELVVVYLNVRSNQHINIKCAHRFNQDKN